MDPRRRVEDLNPSDVAADFVRFCYRRRRVGWPELYDEMCAVAARGSYHGWGFVELAEHGVGFGLSEMPRLAAIVAQIAGEDTERRRVLTGVMSRRAPVGIEIGEEDARPHFLVPAAR
jgi:hypothetical protein